MRPNAATEANRTPEVAPALRHTVPWRVTSVTAVDDARLHVTFVDGTAGDVDMRAFLRNRKLEGTIFEPLRDPRFFGQVRVVLGAVEWPNGADMAPDAMYDAIRSDGCWSLD